jgi:hypothetical protein
MPDGSRKSQTGLAFDFALAFLSVIPAGNLLVLQGIPQARSLSTT